MPDLLLRVRLVRKSVGKILRGKEQLRRLAVTRQRHITGMPVKVIRGQHIAAIHRHTLGFVDGRGGRFGDGEFFFDGDGRKDDFGPGDAKVIGRKEHGSRLL